MTKRNHLTTAIYLLAVCIALVPLLFVIFSNNADAQLRRVNGTNWQQSTAVENTPNTDSEATVKP